MPKIYEYLGFVFFFYSNEHLPIHCHITKAQKEVKAELEYVDGKLVVRFLKIKRRPVFDGAELNEIEHFIRKKHLQINQKWQTFFVFGKSPTFDKINKKI